MKLPTLSQVEALKLAAEASDKPPRTHYSKGYVRGRYEGADDVRDKMFPITDSVEQEALIVTFEQAYRRLGPTQMRKSPLDGIADGLRAIGILPDA